MSAALEYIHVLWREVLALYCACHLHTVFPRVVPAGTINIRLRDDAGTI